MTKKPTPPRPSTVSVSPSANLRSFIEFATCSTSLRLRSEKSGTRWMRSTGAPATAHLCQMRASDGSGMRIAPVGEDVPVRLTIVGCSPAWPNPGGAQSGYLVEGRGRLLLDCGPGVLARLREREAWPRVDAIAITHFHLDHWGDIVPWVWGSMFRFDGGRPRPQLWLPPHGRTLLERFESTLGAPQMFERTFELREYQPRQTFSAAGLQVTAIQVPHYVIETYGFRVSDGTRTLAYSGDSCRSRTASSAPTTGSSSRSEPPFGGRCSIA